MGYVGVQITDRTSITCTLKIGPLYPEIKNMKKWEIVLLLIAAIATVIGVGFWIAVIWCKCVASQLIMGCKAQGVCGCGCGFTICIQRTNPLTYRHYSNRTVEN